MVYTVLFATFAPQLFPLKALTSEVSAIDAEYAEEVKRLRDIDESAAASDKLRAEAERSAPAPPIAEAPESAPEVAPPSPVHDAPATAPAPAAPRSARLRPAPAASAAPVERPAPPDLREMILAFVRAQGRADTGAIYGHTSARCTLLELVHTLDALTTEFHIFRDGTHGFRLL